MLAASDILHDLERYVYAAVAPDHGEKTALACAGALFQCLFLNFRKQSLYVPTTDQEALQRRYEAIWCDFTGHNHDEVALKYHLSLQQVYSIVRKMRRASLRQYQADLFPVPSAEPGKPLALQVFEDYLPRDLAHAGLPEPGNIALARQVAAYLCERYAGLSIRITEQLARDRRHGQQGSLF